MRVVAVLQQPDPKNLEEALEELASAYPAHGFARVDDPHQRDQVMAELIRDMSEKDRSRFLGTVRMLLSSVTDDTIASISMIESAGIFVLRFRNAELKKLVPRAAGLLHDVVNQRTHGDEPRPELLVCEVRERGHHDGFLYGTWSKGEPSFRKFIYSGSKAFYMCITFLFIAGLLLETLLTLLAVDGRMADLGLRLGAPMLVSSSVIFLERGTKWGEERRPRLRWQTEPPYKHDERYTVDDILERVYSPVKA